MGRLPRGLTHGHRGLFDRPHAVPPEQGRTSQSTLQAIDAYDPKARTRRGRPDGGQGGSSDCKPDLIACPDPSGCRGEDLEVYWSKDGEVPSTYTINLSCRFVALAHAIGGLDEDALRRLGDVRFALEQYHEDGMTPKNLALIRQVLTDGVWPRVVNLPEKLMRQARSQRRHAPVRAAVLAQIASAVAILTVAPVRLGNLANIRLGENLIKPGGPHSTFWLTFPKYDVKNGTALQFKLDETVTAIIDEYVHDFRPALMRRSNADWLFPGESGEHKEKISFSTQIVERVHKSTGLRITVHQFRHAAGALILKHRPGDYELVRRILGHKSIQTTINFYCSLETTQASEIFTEIVRQRLDFKRGAA